jgi:hypothetical protein
MLFSAGMGIGLVFYGAAEPMSHFAAPPTASHSGLSSGLPSFNFPIGLKIKKTQKKTIIVVSIK